MAHMFHHHLPCTRCHTSREDLALNQLAWMLNHKYGCSKTSFSLGLTDIMLSSTPVFNHSDQASIHQTSQSWLTCSIITYLALGAILHAKIWHWPNLQGWLTTSMAVKTSFCFRLTDKMHSSKPVFNHSDTASIHQTSQSWLTCSIITYLALGGIFHAKIWHWPSLQGCLTTSLAI